jgi:hypothetical protein
MVRRPAPTSSATRPAVPTLLETRLPVASSTGRGFQTATNRSPRGEPSSTTASTDTPQTWEASTSG